MNFTVVHKEPDSNINNTNKIRVFGIELFDTKLKRHKLSNMSLLKGSVDLDTRYLFCSYDLAKNKVVAYKSAWLPVLEFDGSIAEFIKYKQIKRVLDVIKTNTEYRINGDFTRESDELEVKYLLYDDRYRICSGDKVKISVNSKIKTIDDYMDTFNNVAFEIEDESGTSVINLPPHVWESVHKHEKIYNIYGLVYGE